MTLLPRFFNFILIFALVFLIFARGIRADDVDDDGDNRDNTSDTRDTSRTNDKADNVSSRTNDNNNGNASTNANTDSNITNSTVTNSTVTNSTNTNNAIGDGQRDNQAGSTLMDGRDDRTGLAFSTLNRLSTLPTCLQKTLLNYRTLLRNPKLRLQFFRDLYQRQQKDYLDACGEGMVEIGARERRILLGDRYFRRQVEFMMRKKSIGAAIRGPVSYSSDNNSRILTINNQ